MDEMHKNKLPQCMFYVVLVCAKNPKTDWFATEPPTSLRLELKLVLGTWEAIRDKDCSKEVFDATMEDFDEMGRKNEAELATFRAELRQRG